MLKYWHSLFLIIVTSLDAQILFLPYAIYQCVEKKVHHVRGERVFVHNEFYVHLQLLLIHHISNCILYYGQLDVVGSMQDFQLKGSDN